MILKRYIFLSILFVPQLLLAQNTNTLSGELSTKIDGIFSRWDKPNSPGCVVGIVRNDSLIFAKGYGMANLEYNIPNSPETIYHMASVSKQFTAYAMILLARQGKLQLDDDIRKYLPWFPDLGHKISIRHLLHHTSGIRDQWQLLAISGTRIDDVITQEHIVKILSKQQALNFKPGERFSYSNSGYTMMAEIVKAVTGQTLRQFTDSAIFKPLGMRQTHFHDDYTEIVKNRSYSYYPKDQHGYGNSILSYSNAGATSLFTNVNDMAKWVSNFYQPKSGTLQDIETMVTKGKLNDGREDHYALGIVNTLYRGQKLYNHNGGDAGYRTVVNVFPDKKMGFIVFSNLGNFDMSTVNQMADLFIKEPPAAANAVSKTIDSSKAVLQNLSSLKPFLGDYLSDDGAQYKFNISNQKLFGQRQNRKELLIQTSQDTFIVASNPQLKFVFSTTKTGDTLLREIWPGGMVFKKYTLKAPDAKQLKTYTGTYHCPELDCKYNIVQKGDGLVLSHSKYDDIPLNFTGRDHLRSSAWWFGHIKILRNAKDQVIGFEVNDGRIMHLRFNKVLQ
ncbi:serine hydrolase domain-containing protein [Pedobacter deserti]|uniref:serine hydrolase domain-containing protein n=1 Tax=Pedobacter deserti TaxID=2817382 RepID=UPI00210D2B01|nr:serine hydrolase domain-containing protein [Pedobacter sp. SYSU D00382]